MLFSGEVGHFLRFLLLFELFIVLLPGFFASFSESLLLSEFLFLSLFFHMLDSVKPLNQSCDFSLLVVLQ